MKRLLIITQKVDKNDSYFGFFHDWLLEFSKHTDVTVISLEVREYNLPGNVKVLSLGKEKGRSKIKYLFNFYRYILTEKYDAVFAHMSPWYIILGYPFWFGKEKALWYVHRNVDLKLRLAHLLSSIIFTASPEGFGIKSNKVKYVGHAIDINKFNIPRNITEPNIVSIGRITPIKRLEMLIEAVKDMDVKVNIIGEPLMPADFLYKEKLIHGDKVNFVGAVPNKDLNKWLAQSTISVNLCPPGGVDKAVLESMAAHVPVLVSNTAYLPYIEKYKNLLFFNSVHDLNNKIKFLLQNNNKEIEDYLFEKVKEKSSLPNLIKTIVESI